MCSTSVAALKFNDWNWNRTLAREQNKCGNHVNINMDSYLKRGVNTSMLVKEFKYIWMAKKLYSKGAQNIFEKFII